MKREISMIKEILILSVALVSCAAMDVDQESCTTASLSDISIVTVEEVIPPKQKSYRNWFCGFCGNNNAVDNRAESLKANCYQVFTYEPEQVTYSCALKLSLYILIQDPLLSVFVHMTQNRTLLKH